MSRKSPEKPFEGQTDRREDKKIVGRYWLRVRGKRACDSPFGAIRACHIPTPFASNYTRERRRVFNNGNFKANEGFGRL